MKYALLVYFVASACVLISLAFIVQWVSLPWLNAVHRVSSLTPLSVMKPIHREQYHIPSPADTRDGREKRYAVATLITPSTEYCQLAAFLYHNLRRVDPTKEFDFIVAYRDTTFASFQRIRACTVLLELVTQKHDIIMYPIDGAIQRLINQSWIHIAHAEWKESMNRIALWRFTEYDRILYVDADVLLFRNMADLFRLPYDLALAPDQWTSCRKQQKMNGGVMLIRPSRLLYETFVSLFMDHEGETLRSCLSGKLVESDQELVNCMCGFGGAGVARTPEIHCYMMPWFVNVMPQHVQCHEYNPQDVMMIHYAGPIKPWRESKWHDMALCELAAEQSLAEDVSLEWYRSASHQHCYEGEVSLFTLWHCLYKQYQYGIQGDRCRLIHFPATPGHRSVLHQPSDEWT